MSQLADIKSTLSDKWLRDKLTIHERAKLLVGITEDLEWGTYEPGGIDTAIEELDKTDAEAIKRGW
jgi:hypothetical protein